MSKEVKKRSLKRLLGFTLGTLPFTGPLSYQGINGVSIYRDGFKSLERKAEDVSYVNPNDENIIVVVLAAILISFFLAHTANYLVDKYGQNEYFSRHR